MVASEAVGAGARLWAGRDVRRRWVSLVVLGLLAALASGLAMAALAGARRTETAFPRLRAVTRASDALVFPSQVGLSKPDWAKLRAEPYVASVAPWNLSFGNYDGEPGNILFSPVDDTWFQQIDRPVIRQGRMFDVDDPHEVVMDEQATKLYHLHVGTTFHFQFYANGQSDLSGKPPNGPTVSFRIVGVVRETDELLFAPGLVFTSPALLRSYPSITRVENAAVRLHDPAVSMSELERDVPRLLAPGTPVLDLHQGQERVSTAITVEHTALLLLAAAVAAAGIVFVGQALARSAATIDSDVDALRAMGFARRDLATAAALPHLVVAGVGSLGGLAVALALSPRFPIGFAARVDPNKGFHADWVVLGPGVVLTALAIAGGSLLIAFRHDASPTPVQSRPALASRLAALRPLAVGLGASMAFDPGRGRRAVPVRPALIGAIVAILGVTATMTIHHGLDQALSDPSRVGVTWDATVTPGGDALDLTRPDHLDPAYTRRVTASPGVTDVAAFWRAVINVGGIGVGTFADIPIRGRSIDLVTIAGRAPAAPDEADIGAATARALHVGIGDRVRVGGHELKIVGRSFFPVDVHSAFDQGIWVTWPTLQAISPRTDPNTGAGPAPSYAVRFGAHTSSAKGVAHLARRVPDTDDVEAAAIPEELTNLANVRTVPAVLAAFVVFLGLATLGHVLVASVRARRHDLAVFRAIGFTRPMIATMVGAQSLAVAIVGLLLGLPLGYILGRAGWAWVSFRVPLLFASPIDLNLSVVLAPIAITVAVAIALVPAWRAQQARPAEILRVE